jgi:hypothetical protein
MDAIAPVSCTVRNRKGLLELSVLNATNPNTTEKTTIEIIVPTPKPIR